MGQEARLKCPSKADIEALLAECGKETYSGSRDYTMIQLIINTGMSPGDLSSLRTHDVAREYLTLRRGMNVPLLGQKIRRVLSIYLEIRGDIPTDHDYLFINTQNLAALSEKDIRHTVARRCRAACLELPNPFDSLRSYFVDRWLKLGGSLDDIKPLFKDKAGKTRLSLMVKPRKKSRLEQYQEIKDKVVEGYIHQGLSFKTIYARYGVAEKAARHCLKLAGYQPRTVSQAAQMRYTKNPNSSPFGKRLQEMEMRAWHQEERYGTALLKMLAEQGQATLPEIYAAGFSRRQYEHGRDWLIKHGYALCTRSTNVALRITDSGKQLIDSLTDATEEAATHEMRHDGSGFGQRVGEASGLRRKPGAA